MRIALPVTIFFILGGCTTITIMNPYGATVDDYVIASVEVELGMDPQQIAAILEPTQRRLKNSERKRPDLYVKDGVEVRIVYYRSGWNSDGLTTDDEFTPYLFNDGRLVSYGWQSLGGPKSLGQARDIHNTSVNVSNTTIVY